MSKANKLKTLEATEDPGITMLLVLSACALINSDVGYWLVLLGTVM